MRRIPEKYITEHHLTPKNRKESDTTELCQPCHKQIHAVFTNQELKQDYNSVEKLRNADRLESFIDWISGTEKVNIDVDESEDVNRWRSRK